MAPADRGSPARLMGTCSILNRNPRALRIRFHKNSANWVSYRTELSEGGMPYGRPGNQDDGNSAGLLRAGETAENRSACIPVLVGPSLPPRIARKGLAPRGTSRARPCGRCATEANNPGRLPGGRLSPLAGPRLFAPRNPLASNRRAAFQAGCPPGGPHSWGHASSPTQLPSRGFFDSHASQMISGLGGLASGSPCRC